MQESWLKTELGMQNFYMVDHCREGILVDG